MSAAPSDKPTPPGPLPPRPADNAGLPRPQLSEPPARLNLPPKSPPIHPTPPVAEQEKDLWWGAYSLRTMLPSFLVCILLTLGMAAGGWYLYAYRAWPGDEVRYTVYALAGAIWLFQTTRIAYRVLFLNYRLTTRRLFHEPSCFFPPRAAVQLSDVSQVAPEQTAVERLLGVGRVRLILARAGANIVVLNGVRFPIRIAALVEKAAARVRDENG